MSSAYVCLAIKELPVLYTSYKCLYLAQSIVFSYVCTLTLASAIAFITWPCILYREASFLKLTTFVHKRYFSQSIFECLLVLTFFFFIHRMWSLKRGRGMPACSTLGGASPGLCPLWVCQEAFSTTCAAYSDDCDGWRLPVCHSSVFRTLTAQTRGAGFNSQQLLCNKHFQTFDLIYLPVTSGFKSANILSNQDCTNW